MHQDKWSYPAHLMQLHNLVDLLVQHLQAALPQLCLGRIAESDRVISRSRAIHACTARNWRDGEGKGEELSSVGMQVLLRHTDTQSTSLKGLPEL